MSAFPQRQSQRDFLRYYATLKEEDEEEGECLLGGEEDPPSGDDEDPAEVLDGLIDSGIVNDNQARHKQLDAARRAEEEQQLQALARRFEVRAADYDADHESSRRVKQVQATARRARAEAESARRAAEAEDKQRIATAKKRKHDALVALYAAYETADVGEAPASAIFMSAVPAAAPPPTKGGEATGAKKKPFRIAKKAT